MCCILYCVDGNHTCTCIIIYDESGGWDAVGEVGEEVVSGASIFIRV